MKKLGNLVCRTALDQRIGPLPCTASYREKARYFKLWPIRWIGLILIRLNESSHQSCLTSRPASRLSCLMSRFSCRHSERLWSPSLHAALASRACLTALLLNVPFFLPIIDPFTHVFRIARSRHSEQSSGDN